MATHKSAIKRGRQSKERRLRNMANKSRAKTATKAVRLAVADKRAQDANSSLNKAISLLQKAQSKGAIHKNTASRRISRLARQVNTLVPTSHQQDKDAKPGSPEQGPPSSQT